VEVAVVPLRPPAVVAVNAVVVDVEEALGDLGLPPPRNRDDDEEEKTENSFGQRQLQPTSTTGGCRSVKPPLLPLLVDLPDMKWKRTCLRLHTRARTQRAR
jgi:hypothetical protein